MSDQIISRIDDMGTRIDDLEHNINDLMAQVFIFHQKKVHNRFDKSKHCRRARAEALQPWKTKTRQTPSDPCSCISYHPNQTNYLYHPNRANYFYHPHQTFCPLNWTKFCIICKFQSPKENYTRAWWTFQLIKTDFNLNLNVFWIVEHCRTLAFWSLLKLSLLIFCSQRDAHVFSFPLDKRIWHNLLWIHCICNFSIKKGKERESWRNLKSDTHW